MKKVISIFAIIMFMLIGLPALGYLLKWLLPDTAIGESVIGISSLMWSIFQQFELGDLLQSAGLYIAIAVVALGFGITMTRKTEKMIWMIVSLLTTVLAIMTGKIL